METIQATANNSFGDWVLARQAGHSAAQPEIEINHRISILYADNNEDACLMLKTLLGFSGIEVACATTVKETFQTAQNTGFDLYLLDLRFADGSGIELCRRLREFDPETPVVFYTGASSESDRQRGLAAGAVAYLFKPEVETVAPMIFKLLGHVSGATAFS